MYPKNGRTNSSGHCPTAPPAEISIFYAFFIPEIKIFTHPLLSYTFLFLIFDSLPFDTNLYFMNIDLMFVILGLVLLVINYLTGLGNETESF